MDDYSVFFELLLSYYLFILSDLCEFYILYIFIFVNMIFYMIFYIYIYISQPLRITHVTLSQRR